MSRTANFQINKRINVILFDLMNNDCFVVNRKIRYLRRWFQITGAITN